MHLLGEEDDLAAIAREAEADALGMAGGDGSLGPVAQVAIERGLPFVCIPFGTRNHFARDLGLDRDDPLGALDAFGSEREVRIDVGRIGDRVFLNNVSFGVYARLVHRREAHRRRRAELARLRALWLSLRDRHPEPLILDGVRVEARVVLVANNAYELDLFNVGERARLDEGKLHAYLAEVGCRAPGTSESRRASASNARAAASCARRSTASRPSTTRRSSYASTRSRCAS